MSAPAKTFDILIFRERAEASIQKERRKVLIRDEEAKLKARQGVGSSKLLTEEEFQRLREVAPGVMKLR